MAVNQHIWPWLSQPQEAVKANPAWASRGLIGLWNFANGFAATVGGDAAPSGTPDFVASPAGLGWKNETISSGRQINLPDLSEQIAQTNQVTLVLVLGGGSTVTQGLCNLGGKNDTTQSDHYPYRPASTDLIYSSIFKVSRWVNGVASKVDLTKPHVVAVQFRNGKQRYTQAGIQLQADTAAVNPLWPAWARLLVSDHNGYAYSGVTLGAAVFNEYIEDADLETLTRSVEDAWHLFAPQTIWVPVSAGGGPTPAGTAAETDASLTLSGVQLRAVGQAAETDAAQALVAVQIASTGRADETETALALTPVQITVAGLASETDTALALDAGAASAAGIALETDAALALAAVQITATGIATEVDTALALTGLAGTAPGIASETDTAFALAAVQKLVAGAALEVDTALALSALGGTLDLILKILVNRQELNPASGTFTLYDDDGTTVLYTTNAWADAAGTTPYSGGALRRIDALF